MNVPDENEERAQRIEAFHERTPNSREVLDEKHAYWRERYRKNKKPSPTTEIRKRRYG